MIMLLLRILYAKKWHILASALICCAIAAVTASRYDNFYLSKARVQLNIGAKDPVSGQSIGVKYADAYLGTQIELIRDYNVVGRAVDSAGFANSPEITATYLTEVPDRSIDMRRWLANSIASSAGISVIPESSILEIQYSAASPTLAAAMAELLRTAYIEQTLAGQQQEARKQADWFQAEAASVRVRLTEAQKKKTDFERANGVIVNRDGISLDEIRMANQIVPPIVGSSVSAPLPSAHSSAALAALDARIASASATMGPNHPQMMQMREQQAALRKTVAEETAAIRASVPQQKQAEDNGPAVIRQALANAEKNAEAKQLAADIALLEGQYQEFSKRAAELALQVNSPDSGLVPIGPPSIPTKPFFPDWPVIIGLSFSIGLLFGALTCVLLELLYLRVGSPDDLEIDGITLLNPRAPTKLAEEPTASRFSQWVTSLPQHVRTNRPSDEALSG